MTVGQVSGRVVRAAVGEIFKATGANSDGRMELAVLPVGYGFGPPLHIHDVQEDSFYIVDGVITAQLGDDLVELGPGDFATAPPGVPHTFTNTDRDHLATVVNLMTPGIGFDQYITAVMAGADPDEMERLNKEYGVTMVGPSLAEKLGLT